MHCKSPKPSLKCCKPNEPDEICKSVLGGWSVEADPCSVFLLQSSVIIRKLDVRCFVSTNTLKSGLSQPNARNIINARGEQVTGQQRRAYSPN